MHHRKPGAIFPGSQRCSEGGESWCRVRPSKAEDCQCVAELSLLCRNNHRVHSCSTCAIMPRTKLTLSPLVVEQQEHKGNSGSTLLNSRSTDQRLSRSQYSARESGAMFHGSKRKVAPSYVGVLYSTSKKKIIKSCYIGMRIVVVSTIELSAIASSHSDKNVEKRTDFIRFNFK